MISELKGVVTGKEKDGITVMVGGVGFFVRINPGFLSRVEVPCETHLYTRLITREDAWYLYGFESREERNVFDLLLTVKGVGPRVAMEILANVTPQDFYQACISQNQKIFSSIRGVGKKIAERITLELRDRIGLSEDKEKAYSPGTSKLQEATEALEGLGYTWQESRQAVEQVMNEHAGDLENMDLEAILKEALRKLARI